MKIICIGRNYLDHAKELKNEVPTEPVFFMKPETALLKDKQPFFIPDFSDDIHYEVEVVVRINRLGKNIQEKFAHKYYNGIAVGIDFTARDIQNTCKQNGLPWEKAKAFDGSAPLSKFVEIKSGTDINNLNFSLFKNDVQVQQGNTKDMLFKIDEIISYLSRFITFKIGDIIFTGTPVGVGKVKKGDNLKAYLEDILMLTVPVR